MPRPIVAIVGRPNVGKSSLFNRIVGKRHSVVDPTPGVTRDRIMLPVQWDRREFLLVDTGGLVPRTTDTMELRITEQVQMALEEAHVVVLLCDVQSGPTDLDRDVARELRRSKLPSLVVVNKVDTVKWESDWQEFHSLGLGEPVPVSAMSGRSVGDMLDEIVAALPPENNSKNDPDGIKVALLGRPNVGKSSLINKLVGSEKLVVDDVPGTTRDSTDTPLVVGDRRYTLIDTAGLRRGKALRKTRDAIEYFSTLRTISSIERCDVGVVLIDSAEHIVHQDIGIIEQVLEAGKALVIVANKWDVVPEKDDETAGAFIRELWRRYPDSAYYPVALISALTGQRVWRVLEEVDNVYERWNTKLKTHEVNEWLSRTMRNNPPQPSKKGVPRMNYMTQTGEQPPVYTFFVNNPLFLNDQTKRYLERSMREQFDFMGTPIQLRFRRK
jgi:GTPase